MKSSKNFSCLTTVMLACMMGGCSAPTVIDVYNPAPTARQGCVAETDASPVVTRYGRDFRITTASGEEVAWQITHDCRLLLPVDVEAGTTQRFKVRKGSPASADSICVGQIRHDIQDDYAWENDLGGFRLYGPAYRAKGGNVSGYDIWTKTVSRPVLAQRYHDQSRYGVSFHKDQGTGMDAYTVGRTLGAGMSALVADGEIYYPCAYAKCEILDCGPLRVTARITCFPETIGCDSNVVETRIITLDRGSRLNRTLVWYDGLSAVREIATGIVVHRQNSRGYAIDPLKRYIAYADVTDNPNTGNGVIYIGVVNPVKVDKAEYHSFNPAVGDAVGQVECRSVYTPGKVYEYYWGAGWSKRGVEGMQAWQQYLTDFRNALDNPLVVTVK